jgi:hypothetical protein
MSPCILKANLEYLLSMSSKMTQEQASKFLREYELVLLGEYLSLTKRVSILCLICNQESEVITASIRKRQNKGCEKCARSSSLSLSEIDAIKDMQEKGLDPLEPWVGHKTRWLCKCLLCKQEVHVSRDSVRRRSPEFKGCIDCAKIAQNQKMIKDNEERILKRFQEKNLRLRTDYISSNSPIEVECLKCGHIFITKGLDIGRQKYACAKCSGNYIDPTEAESFMISKGYKPLIPFPGSHKSWESIHVLCGNIVNPEYSSINSGNGGCKYCAGYGFQYSKPAYLYLITHEELNAHKIGIANPAKIKKSDRLHRYQHHGWSIIKVWNFPNGKLAEDIENTVLLHLRVNLGIPSYLSANEMGGQRGHTETVSADAISLLELERLVIKATKGLRK